MHLYIDTRRRCAVAVDISASHTSMLVTDLLGHPLTNVDEFPTRRRPQDLVKELVDPHPPRAQGAPAASGSASAWGWWSRGWWTWAAAASMYSPTLGWRDVDLVRAAERGHAALGRGRELGEGLHPGPGVGGHRRRAGGRAGGVREHVRRRGRRHRHRREAGARRQQHRRRVRPRAAQPGGPALLLRPARLLGGLRVEARDHGALPRLRSRPGRAGASPRADRAGDRGPRPGRRRARAGDAARDRQLHRPRASPRSSRASTRGACT